MPASRCDFRDADDPMTRHLTHGNQMPYGARAPSIRIYTLRLDIPYAEILDSFAVLSTDEQQRAARFRRPVDCHRFIVTRAHLRRLLATELNSDPRKIALATGTYGKPCLGGEFAVSGLQFNVSHSEAIAVIALAYGGPIGVDVEMVRSLPDMDALVEQNFSHREREEYAQVPSDLQPIAFFNCWTRKEALVKAWGCGLHYPLDQFDVSLVPQQPARLHRLAGKIGTDCGWQVHELTPIPGAIAAVAVQSSSTDSDALPELRSALSLPTEEEEISAWPQLI